jgi:anthranilate phosphoribosyltransferase
MVGELRNGEITEYEVHPEDFGMVMASNRALKVDGAAQSRTMVLSVLDNEPGAARDIVILNAGAALYAANVAESMLAGIALARAAIESGAAKGKLAQLIAVTGRLA